MDYSNGDAVQITVPKQSDIVELQNQIALVMCVDEYEDEAALRVRVYSPLRNKVIELWLEGHEYIRSAVTNTVIVEWLLNGTV